MMATNSESRKRHEALFSEPQWRSDVDLDRPTLNGRLLDALRKVYPSADPLEADALRDALEDEGLL